MANNRPIVRNRKRWRFSPLNKRPTRWAALSPEIESDAAVSGFLMTSAGNTQLPLAEIITGADDVQPWADAEEITVDRIVGSIAVQIAIRWQGVTAPQMLFQPAARFGILAVEDGDPNPLDLWEQETLETYEWMWLKQVLTDTGRTSEIDSDAVSTQWVNFDVDIRNRRKIGKQDVLCLYGGIGYPTGVGAIPGDIETLTAYCVPMLRTIMMSR